MNRDYLKISPEVAEALEANQPVVALESSVITHGLPYPLNVETFHRAEKAVRSEGAVPATLAISNGKIVVGLSSHEVEEFASNSNVQKVSSRDIALVLSEKKRGATTIAASMQIAEMANIKFFSSAGLGGVHRYASESMDISADLIELTKRKVVAVSAGVKSILDISATLEYLETQGVPIISYGTDEFPAFYFKSSGFKTPHRLDDLTSIARAIRYHWDLGNSGAYLITAPINDEYAIDRNDVEGVIADALAIAQDKKITGQAVTPYLMRAIGQATDGKTLKANCEVLVSNAAFAAKLATIYFKEQGK